MGDEGGAPREEGRRPDSDTVAETRGGWPRLRRRPLWAGMVVLALVVAGVGAFVAVMASRGSTAGTWFKTSSPKLSVSVAAGCPASIGGYGDVVNTFAGPPLVPAGPNAGLICQYGEDLGSGLPSSADLVLSTSLDRAQAQQLAAVIRQIDLAPPSGASSCPAGFFGAVTVIGLSYPGRADVGLWYSTSGCQTLDNGRIGAFEGGNPSFYQGFETTIDRLSPPAVSYKG